VLSVCKVICRGSSLTNTYNGSYWWETSQVLPMYKVIRPERRFAKTCQKSHRRETIQLLLVYKVIFRFQGLAEAYETPCSNYELTMRNPSIASHWKLPARPIMFLAEIFKRCCCCSVFKGIVPSKSQKQLRVHNERNPAEKLADNPARRQIRHK
jgi:hypothetical protein